MASSVSYDIPTAETRAPQLKRWDWQQLERLTEALLAQEPGVLTASQYGTLGQTQFGIDTKAELSDGGCVVASCKKQDEIADGQLDGWSTAFLKHWDARWATKDVRRFILVTTADVSRTQIVDAADGERSRFAAHGVGYELWGQSQLIEKMRPHRGIVAQFVGIAWVDILCGPQQREALQPEGASVGIEGVGARQIAELRSILSGEAEQRVARALDDLRAGDTSAVADTLADLRAEPLWSQLEAGAQARVLRFAAAAALHRDDFEAATAFANQADRIQPADEPRIAARIAYHRDGARAGLTVLGTPITRDGRQLEVAFLLTVGDLDGAEAVLSLLQDEGPDPETTRLQIWALLMRDHRDAALTLVDELERHAGHWIATMRTAAIVRYAASLSPLLAPEWFLNASPVDLDLVRDDDVARQMLEKAIAGFQALVARTSDPEDQRWLLAALSNQRERREEAQALAQRLAAAMPADPVVIAWCLARRYEVDLGRSRELFSGKYAEGDTEQVDVRVFTLILLSQEEHEEVRAALAAHLSEQSGDARTEAETWIARITAELDDGEISADLPATDNLVDDIQRARTDGDWSAVDRGFAQLAGGARPQPQTLAAAQLLAAEAQWDILAPHRDAILSFGTSEAVRIVAYLVAATDTDDALVEFVAEHRAAFRNSEPPPDLRRLIVDRQRRAGDLVSALAEARALSAQSGVSNDRQLEAELRAGIGDTAGAAMIVRDLMGAAELGAGAALQWGEALRGNDLPLARALWQYAVGKDAERRHAVTAYFQAYSLGLEQEAGPLFAHVARAAEQGSHGVWKIHVDDLPNMLRDQAANTEENSNLYLDGNIPGHLLAEQEQIGLDALLLGSTGDDTAPLRIRLLRNGARPRHLPIKLPWTRWHLHMDVSALLIAAEYDLMDVIEQHPNPVTISSAVPSALIDMQRLAAPGQPARLELLRDLVGYFGNGLTVRQRRESDHSVGLHVEDETRLVDLDPRQLVDAAFAAGLLDEAATLRAREILAQEEGGSHGDASLVSPIAVGAGLWLMGAAAEQIARTGLLPTLSVAFDIGIDPEVAEIVRRYVQVEGAKAERAAWVDSLRERLLRGIEAGRFQFVKRRPEVEAANKELATRNASTISLMDMLIAESVEGGVTWFEDRQLTGYPANRGHILVELVDVLDSLVAEKVLSCEEGRARFHRFLGAGGGFVQLDAEDISPAIRSAPIVDGELRETPALVAIRRNRAATRLLDAHYKIGPREEADDHRPDESRLFTTDMALAEACFTDIWSDPSQSIDDCIIRSEWVWRALRVERALRSIPEAEPGGAARHLATLCFASALESLAIPANVPLGLRRERRRAFADWFWRAAMAPHMLGDRELIERIAQYYEQMYMPRLDGRDPSATNPALEIQLFRIRVAALPRPILDAVSARERLGRYLGVHTVEVTTIRGARFETGRFWRAVRNARRYGRSKIRTMDARRCRIVRTANGVAIVGAVRARLADVLYGVFDPGVAPAERLEEMLADLELTADDFKKFLVQARSAATPKAYSNVIVAARKRSAKGVYEAFDDAFQPRRSIAGEALLPPPTTSLLHFLRIETGERDFSARVTEAAKKLVAEVGPVEALRRLGGLPTAALLRIAGIEASPEVADELARAVTPVAAFRRAEVALASAETSEERIAITGTAIRTIRHGTPALIAILSWAVRAFWQDPEFRALGPADRLALVWAHSGRVLDTFLRRKADPELIARYFREFEFNEPFVDALSFERYVDEDAASPTSLTPDTFLFHALGALVGEGPLSDYVDTLEMESIRAAAVLGQTPQDGPTPAFTLRNFEGPNLLGSFLTAAPRALCELVDNPAEVRTSMVDRAIVGIKSDREDAMSWAILSQHARTGLADAQLVAARDMLLALEVDELEMGARDELPLPRLIVKTMGQLMPVEHRSRILEVIRAVARSAARAETPVMLDWKSNERGTLDPVHEMLEICAAYAAIEREGMFERFEAAIIAAVGEWPAALPAARALIDRVVRTNTVVDSAALWRLYLTLNSHP